MIFPRANPGLIFQWVERWPGYASTEAPPFGGVVLMGREAREILCVVVKVTASLDSGVAQPPAAQEPLTYADQFDRSNCLIRPSDFSPARTGTSVIVEGALEADEPSEVLAGRVRVGKIDRRFYGRGERRWTRIDGTYRPTEATPVERVPLSPRLAFGGSGIPANPVGMGYVPRDADPEGVALHRLTSEEKCPGSPHDEIPSILPLPLSPAWATRRTFGGTYDDRWRREVAPFPAHDLRDEFFDVVHQDYVHRPFLRGGEPLALEGFGAHAARPEELPRFAFHLVGAGFGAPFQLEIVRINPLRDTVTMTYAARLDVSGRVRRLPGMDVVAKRWLRPAESVGPAVASATAEGAA